MTCTCGRPKYTEADLQRWRDGLARGEADAEGYYNPEWARALCWTRPGVVCNKLVKKEQA